MATNNSVNSPLSGTTGSGNFVGSINPTITNSKIISSLQDTNGNTWINVGSTPSAVNYVQISNAATAQQPVVAAGGSDTNVALIVRGQGNAGVAIQGNQNGSAYSSGYVGEVLTNSTSTTSLSTGTAKSICTLSLTAGDWDVWGTAAFVPGGATTISQLLVGISTSNGTFPGPTSSASFLQYSWTFTPGLNQYLPISACQIVIGSTTNVYMTVQASFGVSTLTGNGFIMARRRT